MAAQMKRMKCDFMVHGCRSSFHGWAAETGVASDLAEQCLALAGRRPPLCRRLSSLA